MTITALPLTIYIVRQAVGHPGAVCGYVDGNDSHLPPLCTIREYLSFCATLHGVHANVDKAVTDVLNMLQLTSCGSMRIGGGAMSTFMLLIAPVWAKTRSFGQVWKAGQAPEAFPMENAGEYR